MRSGAFPCRATACASARLTRHAEVANSPIVARHLPLIAEAMPHVAHVAVRNRGTFGGSIALADPAAEMPACAAGAGRNAGRAERRRPARDRGGRLFQRSLRDGAPAQRVAGRGPDPRAASAGRVGVPGAGPPPWRLSPSPALPSICTIERGVVADARLVYFGSEDRPTLAARRHRRHPGQAAGHRSARCRGCGARATTCSRCPMPQGSAKMRLHLQRVLTRARARPVAANGRGAAA